MATITDPQQDSFRLSQLIYDTRYRSATIQVIAFILFMAGITWLVMNTITNLNELGKDFDFGFLGQRAGYDINQRLAEYSNDSIHARAALVGILNTLFLALIGCVTATVIGVIAGVLRLSKNWIVSLLMSVYVEGFRNIPLLLWIVLIFAVVSESTPDLVEFRPGGGADYSLFGLVAITSGGTFIPRPVFADGAFATFLVVFLASILAIYGLRRGAQAYKDRTGKAVPIFPISLVLLIAPLVVTYYVLTAATSERERVILALDGSPDQTLAEYVEEQGRPLLCTLAGEAGSLNLRRIFDENGYNYRAIPAQTSVEAIAIFANENCAVLSVAADRVDETIQLIEQLSSRQLVIDHTITGLSIRTPEEAGVETPLPTDPVNVAILQTTHLEGRAIETSMPRVSERGIPSFEGGWQLRNSLIALWIALSLYTGAFIAEIVRAGILSVSRGQTEASSALGVRPGLTMRKVILPQALRVIIPPLISQYLNLTKNSSLAIAVGYMDVRATLGGITINQTGRELEGMLLLGLFYLVTSLVISGVLNVYNNKIKLKER